MNPELSTHEDLHAHEHDYSDEELREIRKKAFTPELSSLFARVSKQTDDEAEKKEPALNKEVSQSAKSLLLSKAYRLFYKLVTSRYVAKSIRFAHSLDQSLIMFEYQLQRLGIAHYGIYLYSDQQESYEAERLIGLDIHYIGVFNKELVEAKELGYCSNGAYIYVSLYGMMKHAHSKLPVTNILMPVAIFEVPDTSKNLAQKLITTTDVLDMLIAYQVKGGDEVEENVVRHRVHAELIRLQHNYYMLSESVCLVFTTAVDNNSQHIREIHSFYKELSAKMSSGSTPFLFSNTTVIAFLTAEDVSVIHNYYLSIREEYSHLLMFDLEDFKGRDFISRIYSIAYNKSY